MRAADSGGSATSLVMCTGTPTTWSTPSAVPSATCASRSPTGATSAARTACRPRAWQWLPREDLLTFEELERLARIFVERFHVDGIRLTGGEPTVRAHLPVLVSKLARLRLPASADTPLAGQKPDLSITTNGATFRLLAHELRDAGLDRVNVSLDSLRRDRFLAITRRDDLERVLDGIEAAQEAGLRSGQDQLRRRAGCERRRDRRHRRLGAETPASACDSSSSCPSTPAVHGTGPRSWARTRSWPPSTPPIRSCRPAVGERRLPIGGSTPTGRATSASSPASRSRSAATATGCASPPRVSSAPACSRRGSSTCARILRRGGSDDELAQQIERAVGTKWAGHAIGQVTFLRPKRSMSQIGG